ncbi:hypothetical protein KR009_010030 [Drosophila setifemur]|nr:hypothetical protein KR009_010030 [Drosophila setifemur]
MILSRYRRIPVQVLGGILCLGSRRGLKVTIVGAVGGIGQPLALLLKHNPHIDVLALHDIRNTSGVVADLSHICTKAAVCSYDGIKKLNPAMSGADIVVIPAGMPRKPGMMRKDLIDVNASVAADVAHAACAVCPGALLAFITNPINLIVPLVATILASKGCYDPNRLFGVTTLDVVRARTFLADELNVNPKDVNVPVIGGHTGITILPILSQATPPFRGDEIERLALIERIQEAGTEVVKAKAGLGSATLSMAYAANEFVGSLIKAIKSTDDNDDSIKEYAFVESDVTDARFFSTQLVLGPQGVKDNLGLPDMDDDERDALDCMLPDLMDNIKKGVELGEDMK